MKHVLVGLDGSPLAEAVLPFVQLLAKATGARTTLLHVVPVPQDVPPAGEPSLDDVLRRVTHQAEEYLRSQRRVLTDADVRCDVAVLAGDAARELVGYAARESCDLIALATHGRSGLGRWTHGSVADAVLHQTSTPLLLVRPDVGWAAAPRAITRLVVPLDGSTEAATALAVAEPLATRLGVPLAVVRYVEPVLDVSAGPGGMGTVDVAGLTETLLEAARADVGRIVAALAGRGVRAVSEVSLARAADGIAEHVRTHPGTLVVMTTHGRSGWRRLLLGSVARRAVATVAGPMLVCPPPPAHGTGPVAR